MDYLSVQPGPLPNTEDRINSPLLYLVLIFSTELLHHRKPSTSLWIFELEILRLEREHPTGLSSYPFSFNATAQSWVSAIFLEDIKMFSFCEASFLVEVISITFLDTFSIFLHATSEFLTQTLIKRLADKNYFIWIYEICLPQVLCKAQTLLVHYLNLTISRRISAFLFLLRNTCEVQGLLVPLLPPCVYRKNSFRLFSFY